MMTKPRYDACTRPCISSQFLQDSLIDRISLSPATEPRDVNGEPLLR